MRFERLVLHGQHRGPAQPAKLFFLASLMLSLAGCAVLGLRTALNPARTSLLLACGVVWALRTSYMVLYLLPRGLGWLESCGNSLVVGLVLYGLLVFWGGRDVRLDLADALALILFAAGSSVTTGSELARKHWKDRAENRAHLYRTGLFRYAQHINYFGEVVSFCGFALLTRARWAAVVPVGMLLAFVCIHVPALDRHLRERYPAEFAEYQRTTRKLIPFIY